MAISGIGGSGGPVSVPQPFVRAQTERLEVAVAPETTGSSFVRPVSTERQGVEPVSDENSGVVVALSDRPRAIDILTGGGAPHPVPVIREQAIPLSAAAEAPSRVATVNEGAGRVSDLGRRAGGGSIQNAVIQQIQTNNTEMIGLFLDRFF